ncbi:MAG: lipopolysaccharide biosynthesis protein [Candidatus Marinimicrobia bacterium]|jgi:lipopolysaccharide exporter|nr:lipopolysaccharide biosynthesis protein [Candidatus Neomarinimicrobiota bacterium]
MSSLTNKTISATKWYASVSVAQQVIQYGITITLVRLLTPSDFGVMAIVTTFIGIVRMFQDIGLGSVIVQRKMVTSDFIDTVYWFSQALGLLFFIIFSSSALFIANFYENEILLPLIIVASLGFLITPYYMIQSRLLERELDLKILSIVSILIGPLAGAVTIILAYNNWGVWSLVLGGLFGQLLYPIITCRFIKWHPHLNFKIGLLKSSIRFGANLSAAKMIGYVSQNSVFLIIGKILGSSQLGIYRVGARLVFQPLLQISAYLSKPLLAAYSKVQDDNVRLTKGYLMTVKYLVIIIVPAATGIAIIAPEIVIGLLGQEWADTIPIMRMLCIVGVFAVLINTGTSICYAKGRADISLKWNILSVSINIPVIIIVAKYGIDTVALLIAIISLPLFIIMQTWINNLINLSWTKFLKTIVTPILLTIFMAFLLYTMRIILIKNSYPILSILVIEIVTGIFCYTILNLLFNREIIKMAWKLVLNKT